jgi:hypothetical protein
VRQPEPATDQTAVSEQCPDLLRFRVGRDIKVFWMKLQQGITHTAAHQKRLIAGFVQPVQDFQCTIGDLIPGDIVGRATNDLGFDGVSLLFFKVIYLEGNGYAGV